MSDQEKLLQELLGEIWTAAQAERIQRIVEQGSLRTRDAVRASVKEEIRALHQEHGIEARRLEEWSLLNGILENLG